VNIYIYGSTTFNNQVHKVLDHGNIRFKIEDGEVIDVTNLQYLKELILEDPYQIFLIDENKIIEEDVVSKYFKFLLPKDGIEKRLETALKKPKATEINSVEDIFDAFEYDEDKEIKEKV